MLQIVFNRISAAEISQLGTLEQMKLLDDFKVNQEDLHSIEEGDGERFGTISRDGKKLYRYRAGDHRIYFDVEEGKVIVRRVLDANTFADFKFRGGLPLKEDEALGSSTNFWELIEEAEEAGVS